MVDRIKETIIKRLAETASNWRSSLARAVCGELTSPAEKDAFVKWFEKKLTRAVRWVWGIAILYNFSNFLDFCILCYFTWVVLRTFSVSSLDLPPHYFWIAVCMLLVGGARCASASFFMRLLVHPLAYQSHAPAEIRHSEDGHYPLSRKARYISLGAQAFFAVLYLVSFFLIKKFLNIKHEDTIHFLSYLALANFCVGFLTVVVYLAAFIHLSCRSPAQDAQESILRYFDSVLEKAISSGLVGAHDFDFFSFAYTLLAGEFSRNVQPRAVAKNHKDMCRYLYHHRLGPDFLLIFMDDKNAWVQLAAVHIVGFWADRSWRVGLEQELKLPRELPKKLADKVGMSMVGWAATTCIGVLAAHSNNWAIRLVQIRNSSGQSLPDFMADIIDISSNRSLCVVRTLVQLSEQVCRDAEQGHFLKTESTTKLEGKLKNLAEKAQVHRLRVQAAYLLILFIRKPGNDSIRSIVEAIDPSRDSYWFESEIEMLKLLDSFLGIKIVRKQPKRTELGQKLNPPSWLKDHQPY